MLDWGIMGVNILILLLICSNLVDKCMAGCAITPDENGHVTIPDDWSGLVNGAIPYEAFESCYDLQSVTIPDSHKYCILEFSRSGCHEVALERFHVEVVNVTLFHTLEQ